VLFDIVNSRSGSVASPPIPSIVGMIMGCTDAIYPSIHESSDGAVTQLDRVPNS
jgi:hypothetical protein